MEEVWKDIEGYEGYYQISNFGRVKSLSRRVYSINGSSRVITSKIKKPNLNKDGYLIIRLHKDSKGKTYILHRLIAFAFIPTANTELTINHKNGIKTDNRVENLEWVTQAENVQHAYNTSLKAKKLSVSDVEEIKLKIGNTKTKDISKEYNISKSMVSRIKLGLAYKHQKL